MTRCFIAIIGLLACAPLAAAQTNAKPPELQQCFACHGTGGEGKPDLGAPRIAAQSAEYLRKQLESYAQGTRSSAIMEPIAQGLSASQMQAAAVYFSQLATSIATRKTKTTPAAWLRGRQLAQWGDEARHVQACANCHGPQGRGEPPVAPYIAGLDARYVTAAIAAWKNGDRRNDAGQQMATVAAALRSNDIVALAAYFSRLPAPQRT